MAITSDFAAEFWTLASPVSDLGQIDFDATPDAIRAVAALNTIGSSGSFWDGGASDNFAARYTTTLTVSDAGSYTFYLNSDDGSSLSIDGNTAIDNDGLHAPREQSVTLNLSAGTHAIEVLYFEAGGGATLALDWSGPDTGGLRQTLSGDMISTDIDDLGGSTGGGDGSDGGGNGDPVSNYDDSVRMYVFGHSLINHTYSDSNVPVWMDALADAAGYEFVADGQFGFLYQFLESGLNNIDSQWKFDGVESAEGAGVWSFAQADYDSVLITPANFIQWQDPDDYGLGNIATVDSTLAIIDWVNTQEPGITVYIYENWPDMAGYGFPPSDSQFAAYNEYTQTEFHDWWLDYYDSLITARPDYDIRMLPVGPVIAKLLETAPFDQIPVTELYEDDAPHGEPTIYFLASIITYMATYGEKPPADFARSGEINSTIIDNYETVVDFLWHEVTVGEFSVGPVPGANGGAGSIIGTDGDDVLFGTAGTDSLVGGDGIDTADYSNSATGVTVRLWEETGARGDAEGDSYEGIENVTGSAYRDNLIGANDMDNVLNGLAGNDLLRGRSGNDTLIGGAGDDELVGNAGDDTLLGDEGNDVLLGDAGADRLNGGQGDDILTGGAGLDTFAFRSGDGRDTIADFTDGQDSLTFHGGLTYQDLSRQQVGDDVLITYGDGDQILVENMLRAQLTADDMQFVA
ncbi:PA14 domain-containing protein [Microbulbifer sp. S227A]|uniref:PA14 domain-containing protein n=1 Tax=Microbulbifer sp. S227A TaxID=3415131 RepID=UPI003C79E037